MRQNRIGRRSVSALIVVACVIALGAPVALAGHAGTAGAQATGTARATTNPGNVADGYAVFNDYFCAACHSLKAAGPAAHGILGINFDQIHAPYVVAVAAVTDGLPAALPLYPTQMVGFGKVLTKTQIQDVAAFVSEYSGTYKACTECAGVTVTGFPSNA